MLTWHLLRDLDCAQLEEAADGWGAVSNSADAARDRVNAEMTRRLEQSQEGEAAKAAVRRLRQLNENFDYTYAECGLIRTTLNSLAYELRTQQRRLQDALADAAASKLEVRPDGGVVYPAGGKSLSDGSEAPGGVVMGTTSPLAPRPSPDGMLSSERGALLRNTNPNYAVAMGVADRIVRALSEAKRVDERFKQTLGKLKAAPGLKVDASVWTDAAKDAATVRHQAREYLRSDIPEGESAAEIGAWWQYLTAEQREECRAVYPDIIGNLDGIPAAVRDEVNRDNLQLLIGKLEGEDSEKAKTQLSGLKEINHQIAENLDKRLGIGLKPGEQKPPPMYLLGIGDEGRGRAIVSFGNPDKSRNVSAYVPGLGTALDAEFARNDVARARDTAIGAQKYDPSSAAIVWLGYDAPQLGSEAESLVGNGAVMLSADAERGAPAYNSFMAGLEATNDNEDPHLTAIGHSYGSRTVGAATQEAGGIPGADDIILLGSPGVGVDRAEELGVGKEHVFVGAAENDPVSKLPSKAQAYAGLVTLPMGPTVTGTVGDLFDPGDDDIWFGKDPASEAFGGRRFKVDDGPLPVVDGQGPTPAHSNYFNRTKDSVSAANIAAVVSGNPDLLVTESRR
ncbi:alpha/beta hydrolase [Streptomyces parvus]|uniref:alpha/beta hydrolase n=1 Tax=Streptomyces parvus TaxID=66428 RepID=UPI0021018A5B|nr:alpha/beta hydrolase [Streptomyces parvus]MCQ1580969.1 alpha/beta hydrolase family protein [Streptomyces parvus]